MSQCTECGRDFRPNTSWQHFCTPQCRNKHNNREFREAQYALEVITAENEAKARVVEKVVESNSNAFAAIKTLVAKHRALDEKLPRPRPKFSKRVAKANLWSRDTRLELAKLAEAFLKEKSEEAA
jgi:hypothetical protein